MGETERSTEDRDYVRADALRAFVTGLFAAEELPQADAETVAACFVTANLRGGITTK